MKLLSRKTVINEAADQRRQAIDEGLQIARKVDKLRETLASLEKQHTDFLKGMEGELKSKAELLLNEIALRKLEIVQLDERRKALLEPLDKAWEQVKAQQGINIETRDILAKGLIKLADKEKKSQENYEESKKTKQRINVQERELLQVYEKAEQNKKDTEKIKEDALAKMVRVDKYIEEKTQEYSTKEAELKAKERELEISAQKLVDDRQELLLKETLLKDREATLERELKRRKK